MRTPSKPSAFGSGCSAFCWRLGAFCLLLSGLAACGSPPAPHDAVQTKVALSTAPRPSRLQPNVATKAELLERLAPRLSRRAEGLVRAERANGRVRYAVQEGFGHAMLAVRGADGSTELVCVDSLEGAARVLDRGAPPGARP